MKSKRHDARHNVTVEGALPNLIIVGAQKCGTSALHAYLELHPEVSMSRPKELNFFIESLNWSKGLDWYKSQFDADKPVRGEASPNYTCNSMWPGVPERIASIVPNVKLVYLVRDPVERISSHWMHNWAARREEGDLADVLQMSGRSYLARSQYMRELDRFLEFFPRNQILVLDQDQLRHDRAATLRRVFSYAGADPDFTDSHFDAAVHATKAKVRPSKLAMQLDARLHGSRRLRGLLPKGIFVRLENRIPRPAVARPDAHAALPPWAMELLREDAERLREFTGMTLDRWSV